MASVPQHRVWDEIDPVPERRMVGKVTFKPLTGETSQLLRVEVAAGTVFPAQSDPRQHDSHPNEQIDVVVSGRIKFVVEGREWILGPGEALSIPPGARHSAVVLEDTTMFELFVPALDDPSITATEARTP
jgi:quercetin dioxygenase-like cupin family protein